MANLTPDRQANLAEKLYSHVLTNEGRDIAIGLLEESDKGALAPLAETHFHRGCELWAQEDYSYALSQLEISKSIWERCEPHLVHLLQRARVSRLHDCCSDYNNHDRHQDHHTELIAQLHYAVGTVHLGMNSCREALKGFRRAFQVTALGLGMDQNLFGAILYMMRMTLLTMGYSSPKIHDYIQRYRKEIKKECDADRYAAEGNRPRALKKYNSLSFLQEGDWQAKVRVKTKVATLHEEGGDLLKAAKEWSSISAIYQKVASMDQENDLVQYARQKEMSLFHVLDSNEI
ncbi:MAG: hypothetical protein SGILL_010143 [Bacillariaceae sp.]